MIPRPRDFTEGLFKYKTTPEGAPPSNDDLIAVVTNGLHASGMPYFRGILSEQEIRDVVGVVKGFSKAFAAAAPAPIEPPPRSTPSAESVAAAPISTRPTAPPATATTCAAAGSSRIRRAIRSSAATSPRRGRFAGATRRKRSSYV